MLEIQKDSLQSRFEEIMMPQGEAKLIIGEWEAEFYADQEIEDFRRLANSYGFEVGGHPAVDEALEDLKVLYRADIEDQYIVIKDTDPSV